MFRWPTAIFIVTLAGLPLEEARAACSYRGTLYATTSLAEEFRDSQWAVRARLLSASDNPSRREVEEGLEAPWTIYRLQLLRAYKGRVPRTITFFTGRDSGGFYMDRPWAGPDIGGEYLLFLNPIAPHPELPREARGAVFVNYACGQSRPWQEVDEADRQELERLASRR
jgi:hypothetical protein